VEEGSFVKLREASIGYTFPKTMLGKTFNNLSLAVFASNIIIHTNYKVLILKPVLPDRQTGKGLITLITPVPQLMVSV
jgi:hypothetical protein